MLQPYRTTHTGVALSPPRALDASGLFHALGIVGTPVPGHPETCPSFSLLLEAQGPEEGRQECRIPRQGFPSVCSLLTWAFPGDLCHLCHFTGSGWSKVFLPRSVCPGCAGMCVCLQVLPESSCEKQALGALRLLLATLWGRGKECGGIGTCPLSPQGPALGSSTSPAPV